MRLDRVLLFAELLMKIYFETEVIDFTFKGREDFVRQVYGDVELDHYGGIESRKVFELLRLYDQVCPLDEEKRNPFRTAVSKTKLFMERNNDIENN